MTLIEWFVAIGLLLVISVFGWVSYTGISHPCTKYKTEQQWKAPMYLQPGIDGGISMPISNGKWVDVQVCIERK